MSSLSAASVCAPQYVSILLQCFHFFLPKLFKTEMGGQESRKKKQEWTHLRSQGAPTGSQTEIQHKYQSLIFEGPL